ncbi:WxL domain-containing protein [Carnobacterium gallinarum]|uniref:WxL domain-containing protein n=1 Tax=Carnobacterium gallinarum TaxID=2749 RepID=UPI000550798A|nr:WxL domain-containing protein [Carnobacterium gallinarum]
MGLAKVTLIGLVAFSALALENISQAVTLKSSGDITYLENTTEPELVDPEKPGIGENIKPVEPNPGTPGPLSIDYVSNFHFNQQMISGNDATYYSTLTDITDADGSSNPRKVPNYIQVTDNRGSNAGWSLAVKQEGQLTSSSTKSVLEGAKIQISNLASDSKNKESDGSNVPSLATSVTGNNYTLVPGTSVGLVNAATGQGVGSWTTLFGSNMDHSADTSVSLFVPGKTAKVKEAYKATISWIISADPSN